MPEGGESMKRVRITDWPVIPKVNVNPTTFARIEDEASDRGLSVSALVREALDARYRPRTPQTS
jgi:hypothetical protein